MPRSITMTAPAACWGLALALGPFACAQATGMSMGISFGAPVVSGSITPRAPVTVIAPQIVHAGAGFGHAAVWPRAGRVLVVPAVPGLVTFATAPTIVVSPGPVIVNPTGVTMIGALRFAPAPQFAGVPLPLSAPPPVIAPPIVAAQPLPPAIAPASPLFFAPPVQIVAPAAVGGQVLIIRRSH